jgi:serine/threonine-protein kinase
MVETTSGPGADDEREEVVRGRESRVRWGTMLKYLVIGIVAMFLLLVLLDKVLMPWYVKLGAVETVPNVVGISFADAQKRLQKLGFEVKKGEPRFDDRYPAGTVVMQLPYGGSQTKQGRRIYLTLSRGTEVIPVPDLTGMPLREARITLMRNGFDIGEITYEHNDTIMKDLVYAQSILPKQAARPGAVVDVMISRGPTTRFTMMPNLLSLDIEQARARLENAGMVLGIVKYKDDPTYVKNTVIEQGIAPYAQVAQGAAVDVTVSGTPDPDESSMGDESEAPPEVQNIMPRPVAPKPQIQSPQRAPLPPTAPHRSAPPAKPAQGKAAQGKPAQKPAAKKTTTQSGATSRQPSHTTTSTKPR